MKKVQLLAKIEEIVTSQGFLPIEIVIRGDNHLRIIEIFIDSENAVTAEDCSLISKLLNDEIDKENLIDSNFRLDVSSPGVDRPLKFLIQYKKHINRKFEISYLEQNETKKITAKLIRIDENKLVFGDNKTEQVIDFSNITKAKVLISF